MPELVCAKCGEAGNGNQWYRNVEVTGIGWANAEIQLHEDGSVSGTVDSRVQEIDYDTYGMRHEEDWGCSNCGFEAPSLETLVKIVYDDREVDPRDLTPIPGQMSIDDAVQA